MEDGEEQSLEMFDVTDAARAAVAKANRSAAIIARARDRKDLDIPVKVAGA